MKQLATLLIAALALAACGNCEIQSNNERTKGGCSVFNTGF